MNRIQMVFIAMLTFAIIGCKEKENRYMQITGNTQGTTYNIMYKSANADDYSKEIDSILLNFDASLSTYLPNSIISKVNNNETPELDHLFRTVFKRSLQISRETDGAFDISIGQLSSAYGFGFKKKEIITKELIDSLLQYVGYNKISLSDSAVIKTNPNIMLDVNAIAQGYSVDVICDFFESKNITDYMVEIGGEVRAKGVNKAGTAWRIGIDKPIDGSTAEDRELQTIVNLSNKSLATSGNYRKFYVENDMKYSHTINPHTGFPVKHNLLSATVIANNCMDADAYATVCMVLGPDAGMKLIKNLPNVEAYFIIADSTHVNNYRITSSPGFAFFLPDE
ncbi:MAG TPA: thiamine biosynthesis protein ApbE [Bacteroidales bacterium]|nr:thiamine biosynthesis protein ApbE [Bacteroidales bacterium]